MDLHPEDVGYTTMAFQITSPTLNETLKICVGKPYTEKGMKTFRVYKLNKKGDQVESLVAYYRLENDIMEDKYLDKDGDFNIKELGEPEWIQAAPKKPNVPEKEKEKEKEPEIVKMEYVVMEDTHSPHSFYDALLRAKSTNPTAKSVEADILAERRRVGGLFTGKDAEVIEMYKNLKTKVDKNELMMAGLPMKEIPQYAPLYEQVASVAPDKLEDAKNDLMDKLVAEKGLPEGVDRDLFAELNENDLHPIPSADVYVMVKYFNRNTELEEKEVVPEFVKSINGETWVIPDVMKMVQESDNLQFLPLHKEESYVMVEEDLIVRSTLDESTKFVMVDYVLPPKDDPYVKLVSFQSTERVQSLFTKEELPEAIRDMVSSNPAFQKVKDDKTVVEAGPAPLPVTEEPVAADVKEVKDTPAAVQPPPLENEVVEDLKEPEGEPMKLNKTVRNLKKEGGPKTAKKGIKDQLAEAMKGIPKLTKEEEDIIKDKKFKTANELLEHMKESTLWGAYCFKTFEPFDKKPSVNAILKAATNGELAPVFRQTLA
jgi:hypothetical protein